MDFTGMTFIGLMTIGFVNVVTMFFPAMESKYKFTTSILFAFVLTFVPMEFQTVIFDKAKLAIETALMASGIYKLVQTVGNK